MNYLLHISTPGSITSKIALPLVLLWTVCSFNLVSQSLTDSIFHIPDVVIKASRFQHFRNDIKTDVFGKDELSSYAGESLGHLLISSTALNVRSYGTGGALADVSLRGSSTSQVQVNWNGFPINSVTLGSCDLSMIPAAGFDRVSVVYGAPGSLYGSGTFGGAINLDNDLKLGKTMTGSVSMGYESLKSVDGSASFNTGNNNLLWKASLWGASSENEFTYYDYIRQSDRKQTDGKWHDAGTIQQVIFRLSPTSTIEAGIWYQVKAYSIPSRIGSVSYEAQRDSTLKVFSAYKISGNRWGLQVKAAAFNDTERYTQKASAQATENSIDSRVSTHQVYGDANFRYFVLQGLSVDAGIIASYITANVSEYGQTREEKGLTAFAGIKYDKNRLSLQGEIRNEWNSDFHSGVLPSFGIAWKVMPDKWTLRANISQKFRKPTFNDLFWIPGGNSDLKPESGYSVETGSAVKVLEKENIKLSADIGVYWSQIYNMIVWSPANSYWEAKNYQNVKSVGMDGSFLLDIHRGRFRYHSLLMVMLNKSDVKTNSSGELEIMPYSPRIITSWDNSFTAGIFDFTICHHFTADRFYDDDLLLQPYQIVDIQTGINIPVHKVVLALHVSVKNLTNTSYELIRLYPMPGRYWSMRMNFSF